MSEALIFVLFYKLNEEQTKKPPNQNLQSSFKLNATSYVPDFPK